MTLGCVGFAAELSSLQRLSLFGLTRFTDSCWEKAKSSALNNLKDRVFCIHSFLFCMKKKYRLKKKYFSLKKVSILLAVLKGKVERKNNVSDRCGRTFLKCHLNSLAFKLVIMTPLFL